MSAVPKAIPTAVAPSAKNSVPVLTDPQLGPHVPMTGSAVIPVVPKTELPDGAPEPSAQPGYGGGISTGNPPDTGQGAPSLPVDGFLFRKGPIDPHYQDEIQAANPYGKVNNPPTRGMFTFVKDFVNGIGLGTQNRTPDGFNVRSPQQRVSHMRVTPPPHGAGYAPETYVPGQRPQAAPVYKFNPVRGTQPYGTGVLNSETLGAGQTAGGIGGNQYTPAPGPPPTTSTAGNTDNPSGMPTWG